MYTLHPTMLPRVRPIKLLLLFMVYSVVIALLVPWRFAPVQVIIAIGALSIFVVVDVAILKICNGTGECNSLTLFSAYYVMAFSFATIGIMASALADSNTYVIAEQEDVANAVFAPMVRAVVRVVLGMIAYCAISTIACVLALFSWRRHRLARWIVGITAPGAALLVVYVLGVCYSYLFG